VVEKTEEETDLISLMLLVIGLQ